MQKLLIADCSEEYRTALTAALQDRYHIRCCRTGTEAWTLLHQERPDILLLDLMLPELDGITLLERICADGIHPMVLALTPLWTDYVYGCTQQLGVEYDRLPQQLDGCNQRLSITVIAKPVRRLVVAIRIFAMQSIARLFEPQGERIPTVASLPRNDVENCNCSYKRSFMVEKAGRKALCICAMELCTSGVK